MINLKGINAYEPNEQSLLSSSSFFSLFLSYHLFFHLISFLRFIFLFFYFLFSYSCIDFGLLYLLFLLFIFLFSSFPSLPPPHVRNFSVQVPPVSESCLRNETLRVGIDRVTNLSFAQKSHAFIQYSLKDIHFVVIMQTLNQRFLFIHGA